MNTYLTLFYTSKDKDYEKNLYKHLNKYKEIGIKDIFLYTEDCLPKDFEWLYKDFFQKHRRGYGYWAWKSLIIYDSMKKINDGDMILYHDVGRSCYPFEIKSSIIPLAEKIKKENKGIGIAKGPFSHKEFCKRDAFYYMGCDEEQCWNLKQLSATWSFWEKSELSKKFITDWIKWCFHEKEIITDSPNRCELPNLPEFKDNRHDQAILTNLLYLYNKNGFKIDALETDGWEKDINNFLQSKFINKIDLSQTNKIEQKLIDFNCIHPKSLRQRDEYVKTFKKDIESIGYNFNIFDGVLKSSIFIDQDMLQNKIINFEFNNKKEKIIFDNQRNKIEFDRELSQGELACMLSHFLLWQKLKNLNKKGYFILEDDINIIMPKEQFKILIDGIPDLNSFDICYFTNRQGHNIKNKINEFYYEVDNGRVGHLWDQMFIGTYAYLLTKNGLEKLLKNFTLYCNADGFLHRWINKNQPKVLSSYIKPISIIQNIPSMIWSL